MLFQTIWDQKYDNQKNKELSGPFSVDFLECWNIKGFDQNSDIFKVLLKKVLGSHFLSDFQIFGTKLFGTALATIICKDIWKKMRRGWCGRENVMANLILYA